MQKICNFALNLNPKPSNMCYTSYEFQFFDLDLFNEFLPSLERWEVLSDQVMCEDFRKQSGLITFTDSSGRKSYSHTFALEPMQGFSVIKVANRNVKSSEKHFWDDSADKKRNFASVAIFSNKAFLYISIEDNKDAFDNTDEVMKIVMRGLNAELKKHHLNIMKADTPPETKNDCLDYFYIGAYIQGIMDKIDSKAQRQCLSAEKKEIRRRRKDDRSYRDCITVKDKDAVLKIAHEYSDGITKACVVMIVQRAMIDAGVLSRPSHRAFVEEFGSGEGRSASSYSEITNGKNLKYNKDRLYLKLLDIFTKIKNEQN